MRYVPGRAFPAYAFVPGRDPHPTRDPAGHSFGAEEEHPAFLPAEAWRDSTAYLWGADLYNHGFLWEAHEAWEGLWHVSKPDRILALYLQGLIQCAAAWLKVSMQQPRGVERLAALALEKLDEVARVHGPSYMGLELDPFRAQVRAFAGSNPTALDGYPLLRLGDDT